MAFALAHAQAYELRRVIVVIPFLSIIEQNAEEYRRILGGDCVLEHHSAVRPRADVDEERTAAELATENWDAPIIVTTSVQFLESLFADSPAKCRKLHRIAKSIVVLDEVQTLPAHLLRPTLDAFRRLQRDYGASFVYCSATQPAFRKCPQLPEGFTGRELRPIASNVPELFRKLRRVDYHIPKPDQRLEWPELASRLAGEKQTLCVVNLRRHAATVWEEVRKKFSELEKSSVFHPADDGLPQSGLYQTATAFAASMLANLTPEELAADSDLFGRYFARLHALAQEKGRRIQELRQELMFRSVAREAKVIQDDTRPIIVAYRAGADLVEEIQSRQPAPGAKRFDKRDLRNLQRYMVNVVRRDFDILLGQEHLREMLPHLCVHVLKSGHYHPDLGLLVNRVRPLEDFLQ
jgi:CRISPR-associated endonuclease/helicase Cas3